MKTFLILAIFVSCCINVLSVKVLSNQRNQAQNSQFVAEMQSVEDNFRADRLAIQLKAANQATIDETIKKERAYQVIRAYQFGKY